MKISNPKNNRRISDLLPTHADSSLGTLPIETWIIRDPPIYTYTLFFQLVPQTVNRRTKHFRTDQQSGKGILQTYHSHAIRM